VDSSTRWTFYETEVFVEEAPEHLNAFELNALRQQLALQPLAGKPVPGASPLISIDFAGATVLYSVNPAKRTIALIQIGKATGKPVEIEAGSKSRLKEVASLLRKGGYIAAGKEAVEWLIDIVKDWF
jgi:hypothetical protein